MTGRAKHIGASDWGIGYDGNALGPLGQEGPPKAAASHPFQEATGLSGVG